MTNQRSSATNCLDEVRGRIMDMLEYQCLPVRWALARASEADASVTHFEREWRAIEARIGRLSSELLSSFIARNAEELRNMPAAAQQDGGAVPR